MRKAAINIFLKDLEKIVSQDQLTQIIEKSKSNPVRRFVLTTTKKISQKVSKAVSNYPTEFHKALQTTRIAYGHKFSKQIFKEGKQYVILCEISKLAQDFCDTFELGLDGFEIYCDLGIYKMGNNYRLSKFKYYHQEIIHLYEQKLVIGNDETPEETKKMFLYYVGKLNLTDERSIKDLQKSYYHDFVYAVNEVTKIHSVESWVDAQFKGLKYLDVIPEPYQLHGEDAVKRALKHRPSKNWRTEARKKIKTK